MKTWIYGHHIKPQWLETSSLEDLARRNLGSLPKLISGKKTWKICQGDDAVPTDDFTIDVEVQDIFGKTACVVSKPLRTCGLTQFAHLKIDPLKSRTSRCMLMNDEVAFQFSTGSYVAYRLETKKLALDFWKMLVPELISNARFEPKKFSLDVGDQIELLEDVLVDRCIYRRGDVLRVYDINQDSFVPAPILGKTLLKIPGTRWAHEWIGYGWIPLKLAKLHKALA